MSAFAYTIDASEYFEPAVEIAETVLNNSFGKAVKIGKTEASLVKFNLEAEASASAELCCDNSDRPGFNFSAEATGSAEVILGPALTIDFGDYDLEFDNFPSGIQALAAKEIEFDGDISVGIFTSPEVSLTGFATTGCNFEKPEVFLELSFSTSFQIGARGEIDARLVFSEFGEQGGKETERVLQTKAQAEIGLFGEASLIFGMTNEGKYYGRYETSGIYLSASASLLGYDFNFYDDPNTIEVEEKIYLLDKEEIILFDSQPLSAQSISASAAGQYLEDALYQEALVLLKEYENKTSEVCAKVRLQVNQDAIMTRSAFLGKLEIENENDEFSIQNIDIDLEVRDANGNLVSSDLFIIQSPVLSGIDAIDGTGIIGINSAGSAEFTIVPSGLAATEAPLSTP